MWDSPEMLKIYKMICVAGIIYGVVMVVITAIGGYQYVKFMHEFYTKKPKVSPVPPLPKLKE